MASSIRGSVRANARGRSVTASLRSNSVQRNAATCSKCPAEGSKMRLARVLPLPSETSADIRVPREPFGSGPPAWPLQEYLDAPLGRSREPDHTLTSTPVDMAVIVGSRPPEGLYDASCCSYELIMKSLQTSSRSSRQTGRARRGEPLHPPRPSGKADRVARSHGTGATPVRRRVSRLARPTLSMEVAVHERGSRRVRRRGTGQGRPRGCGCPTLLPVALGDRALHGPDPAKGSPPRGPSVTTDPDPYRIPT